MDLNFSRKDLTVYICPDLMPLTGILTHFILQPQGGDHPAEREPQDKDR